MASAASEILGKDVKYKAVQPEEQEETLKNTGMAEGIADFLVSLDLATKQGAPDGPEDDLERILGHKPESLKQGLKAAFQG